jgi:RNA polymerase sigma factor (sigma-70 family)
MIGESGSIQTNEELVELVKKNNMEAAGQLYFQNLSMIRKVCYQVCKDRGEFEDYLQQSFIHLIEAANRYDPSKGFKFSTYMFVWLRGQLRNYRYEKGIDNGLSSLDFKVGEDEDTNLVELIADPEAEFEDDIIEEVAKEELKKALEEVLGELPADLSQIIKLRIAGKTLKECAAACEISGERVRQKQRMAEKLLKQTHFAKRLKPFIYPEEDYYSDGLKGTGLTKWKNTGYSSTERAVERIIEKQERWRGNGG